MRPVDARVTGAKARGHREAVGSQLRGGTTCRRASCRAWMAWGCSVSAMDAWMRTRDQTIHVHAGRTRSLTWGDWQGKHPTDISAGAQVCVPCFQRRVVLACLWRRKCLRTRNSPSPKAEQTSCDEWPWRSAARVVWYTAAKSLRGPVGFIVRQHGTG